MKSLLEEAKMLYNNHREYITYDNLRSIGYSTFEADEILKYLSLLRVTGERNTYYVRVFDKNCEVYSCHIVETTEPRVKAIIEMRCNLYNIRYTRIIIEKINLIES